MQTTPRGVMGRGIPRSRSPSDGDAYSNRKRRFHGWWRICGGGWPAVCDVERAKIVDPRSASHSRNEASNSFLRYVLVRRWNGLLRGSSRVLAGNGRSYLSRHSPDTERFLRFCFQRDRASRVWGARRWRKCTRDMRTREFCPTLSPLSLSPTYSFPSSLGPIFVSSLRFKFRGKVETRGSFKSATCAGYNIWILKSIFFVAKDFSGCYDRIERIPASKFKHVSSTCIQPYFRKCHVVCQLTSLYLVMQTSSSVFAFNHKNALKDTAYPRELSVDYFYSIFICSLFRK